MEQTITKMGTGYVNSRVSKANEKVLKYRRMVDNKDNIIRALRDKIKYLESEIAKLRAENVEILMPYKTAGTPDEYIIERAIHAVKVAYDPDFARTWINTSSKKREICVGRQIFMYLLRVHRFSHKKIASICGGRDHSTAINSIRVINDLMDTDRQFKQVVDKAVKIFSQENI